MKDERTHLYANDSGKLQISHDEYVALMEKAEEAERLREVKVTVLTDLRHFLGGGITAKPEPAPEAQYESEPEPESRSPVAEAVEPNKVSVEFSAEEAEPPKNNSSAKARVDISKVPAIKEEIAEHFNEFDESGRLFNVFKQYYTCLNETCGGTVRVTMKDGFCSLWNYDEWEEFAFVDIFEGLLRIAIDPRYTDALKSLSLCEAPRLISSRQNVICVQVDDLNNTVLDVLSKAFSEAGMQVG